MVWEITGDNTGRAWRFHPTVDRLHAPGSGERFHAADVISEAYIHRCEKGGRWQDDVDLMRSAVDIARLPAILATPEIRQLLDTSEADAVEGEFGYPGYFATIWEWADKSLNEFLLDPDEGFEDVIQEVQTNVGRALKSMHAIALVHCDVVPNNILRVKDTWKLADLDSCVKAGQPALRQPVNRVYLHPDRLDGIPQARTDFDYFALEQVVVVLQEASERRR